LARINSNISFHSHFHYSRSRLSIFRAKFLLLTYLILTFGCSNQQKEDLVSNQKIPEKELRPELPLFSRILSHQSGIRFQNKIVENAIHNSMYYDYMYNGGGVAISDFNNDGLQDVYFTGNFADNRLYLNKGGLKFEDISERAGVLAKGTWSSGVTIVDINADGFDDIYVCRSYWSRNPDLYKNLLYINNGDLTFTEQAANYGIDDGGHSSQATFFDYDKDGDLDLYVANHPVDFHPADPNLRSDKWKSPPMEDSDHLYRNNGDGSFSDVTKQAGVLGYGFGLGVVVADFNQDGWPDLYVANDFEHPDCYFVNNQNGSFTNQINSAFKHISTFGMGVDAADINNDGLLDLMELDMQSEDNFRQKTMMASMNPERF